MLKITPHTTHDSSAMLTLEGRLAGPWVEELERVWGEFKDSARGAVVVDLTGVTFIEEEGKVLLSQMWRDGAKLLATGCCMRSIVEDITACGRTLSSNQDWKKQRR